MQPNDQETYSISKAKDIDLMEIFQILKQQIWIVLLTIVIFSGLGFWYSSHHKVTLQYQSTTRLILDATADQMSTLLVMFTDPSILTEVSKQIGLKRSPGILASEITVTNINSSQIIDLQVTDSDPYLAAQIANKDVQVFKTEVPRVLNFNKIRQLASAKVNTQAINQSSNSKYTYYGFAAGVVIGLLLGFLRNSFDTSIRSEKELEKLLDLPVIGSISKMTPKNSRKYITKRFPQFDYIERLFKSRENKHKKGKYQENLVREVEREGFSKVTNE